MANCYACRAEIVFDNEHIGKNGKKIPLDPFTKQPHDCPMREKKSFSLDPPVGQFKEEKDDHGNEILENSGGIYVNPKEDKNDRYNELGQQMDNVRKRTPDLFEALAKDDPSYIVDSNHDKKYSAMAKELPPDEDRRNRPKPEYVDHTQAKGTPQFKVFTNANPDVITIEGNEWIKTHPEYNVKLIGQLQFDNGTFAITIYYEETKQ